MIDDNGVFLQAAQVYSIISFVSPPGPVDVLG